MSVMLTEKAAIEVKKIMADQKYEVNTVLRVGVAGGGCSGFQYSLGFDTVNIGVVFFGSDSRVVSKLRYNPKSIKNAIESTARYGGRTCTTCARCAGARSRS